MQKIVKKWTHTHTNIYIYINMYKYMVIWFNNLLEWYHQKNKENPI